MGPVVILDKSAFQALSWQEHVVLDRYFLENLTPILGFEVVGDLAKTRKTSRSGSDLVADLARKFGGSGPATNYDYRTLCLQSLLGNNVPLDGRIIPQAQTHHRSGSGIGMLVQPSPLNHAILRWSEGEFEDVEREFAKYWRESTRGLELESFAAQLERRSLVIPKADSVEELVDHVDVMLGNSALQNVWLDWILDQLQPEAATRRAVKARWKAIGGVGLKRFSALSHHCLRVLLLLHGATRHDLVSWKATNLLDVQYLYYAPFCQVFVSGDRLHTTLAPAVLRSDQTFIDAAALKADIKRISVWRDGLSQDEIGFLSTLDPYPPPWPDSVTARAWRDYMVPWEPEPSQPPAAVEWVLSMTGDER
jgi:hypothetical protein